MKEQGQTVAKQFYRMNFLHKHAEKKKNLTTCKSVWATSFNTVFSWNTTISNYDLVHILVFKFWQVFLWQNFQLLTIQRSGIISLSHICSSILQVPKSDICSWFTYIIINFHLEHLNWLRYVHSSPSPHSCNTAFLQSNPSVFPSQFVCQKLMLFFRNKKKLRNSIMRIIHIRKESESDSHICCGDSIFNMHL